MLLFSFVDTVASGQLGDNSSADQHNPVLILGDGVSEMSGGYNHSLMLKDDGSLWSFGDGSSGQLGDGTTSMQSTPVEIESSGVTSISAGENYSMYLKNGRVYFMGYNGFGALGDSAQGIASFNTPLSTNYPDLIGNPTELVVTSSPSELGINQRGLVRVEILDNYGGVAVQDNGTQITFSVSGNGKIFGVREGIGDGSYEVTGGSETVQVIAGVASVMVSDDTIGSLDISYTNNTGLLDPSTSQIPIVEDPSLGKIVVGLNSTLFVNTLGSLYGSGKNNFSQLDASAVDLNSIITIQGAGIVDASIAEATTYFVKEDGSLWGKGQGASGELGRGSNSNETTPVEMETSAVVRVEAGRDFVLYLKDDNSLWGVGKNTNGQLGDGSVSNRNTAYELFDSGILDFATGGEHSLFVKDDGSAWAVGYNAYGQLGDNTTTLQSTPVAVNGLSTNVIAVAAGENHSLFLKANGSAWAVGKNDFGQLGDSTNADKMFPVEVFSANVKNIFAGSETSFFLMEDGSLWATGQGSNGDFGDGSSADINTPIEIMSSGVQSVAAWSGVTLFLMLDGKIYGSGYEQNGEFGIETTVGTNHYNRVLTGYPQSVIESMESDHYTLKPSLITFNPALGTEVTLKIYDTSETFLSDENTLEFTLSVNNNAFIDSIIKGQGDGSYGVVAGSETVTARNGQVKVVIKNSTVESFDLLISNNRSISGQTSLTFHTDIDVVAPKVSAGRGSSFYLTNQGQLLASGLNDYGQLGDGTTINQFDPIEIYSSNVMDVASGYSHTLILKTDGSVWSTGQNNYGQLGDGSMTQRLSPVQVFTANVIAVYAGDYHSLFLMNNNELWGVGRNDFGQLGDGSTANQQTPILVASDVTMAAAGEHSLMVKLDGSLWATGYNMHGQLGNGSTSHQYSWIQILNSGVESCFVGQNHSFFIKDDGSLWGMGRGDYGQLGDGNSTTEYSPVQILAVGASELVGGFNHTLLIKEDGSLWTFGDGVNGQLGNGLTSSETLPYQVESAGVTSLGAGENFSIYLKNGQFYFMGYNAYGPLGDSSQGASTFSTPVTSIFPDLVGDPFELEVVSAPTHLGINQQGLIKINILDNFGGLASHDNSTQITFSLSGNGEVFGVRDGLGDGSYAVKGGSETVQVIGGVASVLISDDMIETLVVGFSNDGGLTNPENHEIDVSSVPVVGDVGVGSHTTVFMSADGALYGAGKNDFGQLADAGLTNQTSVVTLESSGVIEMAIGTQTIYYIKEDNSLWGIGRGSYGQLGQGDAADHYSPVQIASSSVSRVEAGNDFMLYLKDDGSIWGMGLNGIGQLGDGSGVDQNTAQQIFTSDIVDFSAGGSHSIFVKSDGSAWATGYNMYGQLGDTTTTDRHTPVQVDGLSANVISVTAGQHHSLFLMNDGSVYGVGQNGSGQLGLGHTSDISTAVEIFSANISKVFAGSYNSFFLKTDGSLWATGQGVNGEFGDGSAADISTAVQVLASGVVSVASWENITLFLMDDGSVLGSGQETNGEMGIDSSGTLFHYNRIITGYPSSQVLPVVANNYTVKIKNSTFHPAQGTMVTIRVLDSAGNLINTENTLEFTFSSNMSSYIQRVMNGQGDGGYGNLAGTEKITVRDGKIRFLINDQVDESFELNISNNRSVSGPTSRILISDYGSAEPSVEAGRNSSFYVSAAGELWASGQNDLFQLGDSSGVDQQEPVLVYGANVLDVASGYSHTLILKNDGSVDAVGYNFYGQLGDSSTIDRSAPVQVFAANVVAIWAGEYHSLFLTNNDELYGVGKNDSGELGDGSNTNQSTPILISSDVLDAAAGQHTLYVKGDGSLWATGVNSSGQLGDGSMTARSTPYKVEASGVESVYAGMTTSFYIKENGSLWAMGQGDQGQLGDGSSVQQSNPVQVLASGVIDLSPGAQHTLMIKEDESLWTFGEGMNGRLGHGNTFSQAVPLMLESGNVSSVAAGESFSLYMKDGLVYFMGSNSYGQAANSSLGATDVLSPALTNFTGNMMMGSGNVFELQSTTFASPSTLSRGSDNTLVLEWEFVGGSNIEILDSITLNIQGDINDIDRFEILDVTSSHVSIYSGNAINGDVVSGNAFFTGSPQTVLADETRQYQLIVSVNESTSQDNIEITLPPENLSLSGGNVAQGNVLTTGVLMFVGSSNGNTMANVQGLSDTSIVMGPAVTYLLDDGVLTTRGRDDFGELARTGDANIFLPTNLTNLISVDVGENHGIALGGNGEVYTWGSNLLSQSNASGQPELVTGLGNAIWVGAGAYNSYVVNEVGQLFSTGRNHKAQSGQGFDSISTTWAMVSLPAGNIEQIEAGIEHVLMIIDGSLYGFGSNGFGQLTIDNASVPTLIDNSQSWVEIAAGGFHSLALSGNGNVYSWGKNHRGQLGLGFESAIENNINHVTGMTNIVELAAGYSHSIFMEEVSNVRSLYTSGSSQFGQNGHVNDTSVPTLLSGEPSVDEVSAGPNSTIFKHSGNIIKMMGRESDGTDHVTPIQIFDTGI